MKVDLKDLRKFKSSELKVGGYFYMKKGDEFELCRICEEELQNEERKLFLRFWTWHLCNQELLFVRISDPWKPFER